jgi:hypothetical protein
MDRDGNNPPAWGRRDWPCSTKPSQHEWDVGPRPYLGPVLLNSGLSGQFIVSIWNENAELPTDGYVRDKAQAAILSHGVHLTRDLENSDRRLPEQQSTILRLPSCILLYQLWFNTNKSIASSLWWLGVSCPALSIPWESSIIYFYILPGDSPAPLECYLGIMGTDWLSLRQK